MFLFISPKGNKHSKSEALIWKQQITHLNIKEDLMFTGDHQNGCWLTFIDLTLKLKLQSLYKFPQWFIWSSFAYTFPSIFWVKYPFLQIKLNQQLCFIDPLPLSLTQMNVLLCWTHWQLSLPAAVLTFLNLSQRNFESTEGRLMQDLHSERKTVHHTAKGNII